MRRMRDWELGMGIGGFQETWGRVEREGSSWGVEIRRARRPAGDKRLAATGRTLGRRSTARRVTTSKVDRGRVSARTFCILMSVNVRVRASSRRKADFFWLDSIKVREMVGAQSFIGMPGKPAPEPRSATSKAFTAEDPSASLRAGAEGAEETRGNKWRAANRDSPKWRVTISSGSRMAVRLMREFQRRSTSMYVDILCS